jgi:hypothetical protein
MKELVAGFAVAMVNLTGRSSGCVNGVAMSRASFRKSRRSCEERNEEHLSTG